jgi:hypothetical protein
MLISLVLAAAVQVGMQVRAQRDSSESRRVNRDSLMEIVEQRQRERLRRQPRRVPLTPELERTAFRDSMARATLYRARAARLRQDSSLFSYEAGSYSRLSVGLGVAALGRERLFYRTESAARIRWSRMSGAWVEVKGHRSVFPMLRGENDDGGPDSFFELPYFPGREALWIGSDLARAEVDDRELVHPLALGSEAYYRYRSGDSLYFTLPGGRVIHLRELIIEPRRPDWRLSLGSFWFEVETGQLVRAAYRLAVPIDIWRAASQDREEGDSTARRGDSEVPLWLRVLLPNATATLEAVTLDYGLFGERYWLPRLQYAEGWARLGAIRVPFQIEQSFRYISVNAVDSLPEVPPAAIALADSLFPGDSTPWARLAPEERRRRQQLLGEAAAARARARRAAREQECQATGSYTLVRERYNGTVRLAIRVPCDSLLLATSPELPPSIYAAGEEAFSASDGRRLLDALGFRVQPAWAPQRPRLRYGLPVTRYNRVEGLASGLVGEQDLGRGLSLDLALRYALAARTSDLEGGLTLSSNRQRLRLAAYRRLEVVPGGEAFPGLGYSLTALLLGRDDAIYYRATGAALERRRGDGVLLGRVFVERQSSVPVATSFSLARALGLPVHFPANTPAEEGLAAGAWLRQRYDAGIDPQGWRFTLSGELLGGRFFPQSPEYGPRYFGKGGLWFTAAKALGNTAGLAVTLAGGGSQGLPVQNQFLLGGAKTVRGQPLASARGPWFWLARLETSLGAIDRAVRPVLFADLGWAGQRADLTRPGRVLAGTGIGLSILDGLVRCDFARGIFPSQRLRLEFQLDAPF